LTRVDWTGARARLQAPIFAPLALAVSRLPADRWPGVADLNSLAGELRTDGGRALRFVAPRGNDPLERRHYEQRIFETGEVETRAENWHDLFNALAWLTYPKSKASINAQHAAILAEGGPEELRHRSPERDALTLFDEGGVIVAARSPSLLRLIPAFEWKELFWTRRGELDANMRFFTFGHGCFEQSLAPFIGMVAKTVFVPVDELFFMLPVESQVQQADTLVAAHFAHRARFHSPKAMSPMPILGVPGWHFAAQDEAFYNDARHFRSRPK